MKFTGVNGEYFEVLELNSDNYQVLASSGPSELRLIWFQSDDNELVIDRVHYSFDNQDMLFLTEFHQIDTPKIKKAWLLRFNRPFYCIIDHDSEVGCKGILFFGASHVPVIKPTAQDLEVLDVVWNMLKLEMRSRDNLQLEMLQMMLKRILILCTRIYKNQQAYHAIENDQTDLIREFNFLVEQHFREKHSVADYAALLHKSPKTLANLFKKIGEKTPLQFIQARRMLEARRLLSHADLPVSEIGYEIGFNDIQAFSRFFRKNQGLSPSAYRLQAQAGKMANS